MNGELTVDGNKQVSIKRIKQWYTYDGLLEGLPTTRMNNRILEDAKEDAKIFCGLEEIYLIEPQQTPLSYSGKYPFGDPASMPNVTCIAELWYHATFKDKEKDFSSLGVIWFQNDFAFPIDKEIIEKLKEIPFSKICGEFTY